jgi:hypothetical protein
MTKEQILARIRALCTAYESGFGHGIARDATTNPYVVFSEESFAYGYGREAGEKRAVEPSADANPIDPSNHYFRLCPNGHAPYSISFDGCPSCKAVAMNSAQQLNREGDDNG